MAHTYYTRLTLVHPLAAAKLDPRLGVVIAETATTGRFILSDMSWESAVAPNALTTVAYHGSGDMKILEPLGMSLFDYIRAASYEVGIENHLDARFLLEVEILAENYLTEKNTDSPFKYIWPIMLIATEVKGTFSEKGTEYNIKFVHVGGHAQTDLVQPIKETITVEGVQNLKQYFEQLQQTLEEREFTYAEARQKAGGKRSPGGLNPAKSDDYHDEYHFILEPRLEKPDYTFTTKGPADRGIQGSWTNYLPWTTNRWNITARPGTTIMQQITNVMQSCKNIADILPGRPKPATADASGSSDRSAENMKGMLSNVYQFFRVETHSVYKSYDYIRGRYAVKHVFLIFLADQPNMYQYPDEIDLLNILSNREKVELKLKYYVQEGLLQKVYYYAYTGLNSDILKVDIQFNQSYSLPSFTQIWTDRGQTGVGMMNLQNYNKRVSPFVHRDDKGARKAISELTATKETLLSQAKGMLNNDGTLKNETSTGAAKIKRKQEYDELQRKIKKIDDEILKRKADLATMSIPSTTVNGINNRSELLNSLKGSYAEDINFKKLLDETSLSQMPSHRARMEIDSISESIDIVKEENEKLMEKIFAVQLSPRDLLELELEIIADPFWLGVPNIILQGKNGLNKIELPSKTDYDIRTKLNTVMPGIDPEWATKESVWGKYGGGQDQAQAQWYKGSPLFYFNTQVPDGEFKNDMIQFNANDQIVGIYMVKHVVNEFKNGLWTQKLKSVRDVTIPSYVLPRGLTGDITFEQYMKDVSASSDRAVDTLNDLKKEAEESRNKEKSSNNISKVSGTEPPAKTALSPQMTEALSRQKELVMADPPPVVNNPVEQANALVAAGSSRKVAYDTAKRTYTEEVDAHTKHMEEINKKSFAESNVTNAKPYDAATMSSLAFTRSGNGGLEDWKYGANRKDTPANSNNPAGIGFDSETKKYYKYNNFNDGMTASNEYFNYGNGVKQVGSQGADRLMYPKNSTVDQITYINKKLKGGV
jgi:hypothetical protein